MTDRRLAKVAELAALREREPEHARMLGLNRISLRTLERWAARYYKWGVMGCADDRWLRAGHRIPEPVREAIYAVRAACLHGSRISMASREKKIHQYVREKYGEQVAIPLSETLRLVPSYDAPLPTGYLAHRPRREDQRRRPPQPPLRRSSSDGRLRLRPDGGATQNKSSGGERRGLRRT